MLLWSLLLLLTDKSYKGNGIAQKRQLPSEITLIGKCNPHHIGLVFFVQKLPNGFA